MCTRLCGHTNLPTEPRWPRFPSKFAHFIPLTVAPSLDHRVSHADARTGADRIMSMGATYSGKNVSHDRVSGKL